MFWKLFTQALYLKRFQMLGYGGIGFGFLLMYMALYPSVQEQSKNYESILSSLPKGLVSAFNITDATPTLLGFLSSKHFGFVWALMIILLLVSFGGFALAREIETKTMGLLLTQPVSRTSVYGARLSAGIISLIVFISISELSVLPLATLFGYSIDVSQALLIGLLGFLFGLSILSLSFMISALSRRSAQVNAAMGGILLVMYVTYLVSSLIPDTDWLKYVSLFHYFSPGNVVITSSVDTTAVLVLISTSIIATIVGIAAFNKRDIQI